MLHSGDFKTLTFRAKGCILGENLEFYFFFLYLVFEGLKIHHFQTEINMTSKPNIDATTLQQWILASLEKSQVKERLQSMGYHEKEIHGYLQQFTKLKYGKRQSNGFWLISIGSILGFISCVMTMLNVSPLLSNFFLYGLTSAAIIMVMWGLYRAYIPI